jgi:hypothetical protein
VGEKHGVGVDEIAKADKQVEYDGAEMVVSR